MPCAGQPASPCLRSRRMPVATGWRRRPSSCCFMRRSSWRWRSQRPPNATLLAGWAILVGLTLFAGDLLARHYLGARLFPMAAPIGGVLMIAGWAALAVTLLVMRRD